MASKTGKESTQVGARLAALEEATNLLRIDERLRELARRLTRLEGAKDLQDSDTEPQAHGKARR
jgi:hypothetical protein